MERREELLKSIWLAEAIGPASRLGVALLRAFDTVEAVYRQKPEETVQWDFLTKKEQGHLARILSNKRLDGAERILRQCEEKDIQITTFRDPLYPSSLRSLPTAPMVLYYKGTMPAMDTRFTVAVVGTRSMSDYGRQMAYRMGYGLTMGGGLIVSGMALGVDTVAMMGALDAGGTVVGVLGSGVDVVYPKAHKQVYCRILERGGCILSEYPPGTEPRGYHFPVRNRIISGLSDAGVVVEGHAKSGSLITAKNLIYQGRKLFAVPGQIGLPGSQGPNTLLRNGALPALDPVDVLEEFVYLYPTISMSEAWLVKEQLDADAASRQAMEQNSIGTRAPEGYAGEGNYGGKNPESQPPTSPATAKKRTGKAAGKSQAQPKKKEEVDIEELMFPQWMKDAAAQIVKRYTNGKPLTSLGKENKAAEGAGGIHTYRPEPLEEKLAAKEGVKAVAVDVSLLDEGDMRIYNRMKPNVPVTPDELVKGDVTVAEVLTALTTLEMAGVVEAGSGGYFLRTDPDDFPIALVEENEMKDKE